jgi:hypothetical protein
VSTPTVFAKLVKARKGGETFFGIADDANWADHEPSNLLSASFGKRANWLHAGLDEKLL